MLDIINVPGVHEVEMKMQILKVLQRRKVVELLGVVQVFAGQRSGTRFRIMGE